MLNYSVFFIFVFFGKQFSNALFFRFAVRIIIVAVRIPNRSACIIYLACSLLGFLETFNLKNCFNIVQIFYKFDMKTRFLFYKPAKKTSQEIFSSRFFISLRIVQFIQFCRILLYSFPIFLLSATELYPKSWACLDNSKPIFQFLTENFAVRSDCMG